MGEVGTSDWLNIDKIIFVLCPLLMSGFITLRYVRDNAMPHDPTRMQPPEPASYIPSDFLTHKQQTETHAPHASIISRSTSQLTHDGASKPFGRPLPEQPFRKPSIQ